MSRKRGEHMENDESYFIKDKFYGSPLSMTSQFYFCPIPFRMDTYSGCYHDCLYCFANNSDQKHTMNQEFKAERKDCFVKATKLNYIKKYLDIAWDMELIKPEENNGNDSV